MKTEEMREKTRSMAYRRPIIDRLDRQTLKGIHKYGDTLDKSNHLKNGAERLEYLAEELTDGLVYIEHTKAYIRQLEEDRLFLFGLGSRIKEDALSSEERAKYYEVAERTIRSRIR